MALEEAKEYLVSKGFGDRILIFDVSSATVELAAVAVGNNSKYKGYFHKKAKMLTREEENEI